MLEPCLLYTLWLGVPTYQPMGVSVNLTQVSLTNEQAEIVQQKKYVILDAIKQLY